MEDTDDDVMAVTDSEEDLHPSEIRKRCMFLHNTKLTARLSTFSFYCKSLARSNTGQIEFEMKYACNARACCLKSSSPSGKTLLA